MKRISHQNIYDLVNKRFKKSEQSFSDYTAKLFHKENKKRDTKMLTPQQLRILKYKVAGNTNKEISELLGNSENTVKRIFTEVCMKLNLNLSSSDSRAVRELVIEKALADYLKNKNEI